MEGIGLGPVRTEKHPENERPTREGGAPRGKRKQTGHLQGPAGRGMENWRRKV